MGSWYLIFSVHPLFPVTFQPNFHLHFDCFWLWLDVLWTDHHTPNFCFFSAVVIAACYFFSNYNCISCQVMTAPHFCVCMCLCGCPQNKHLIVYYLLFICAVTQTIYGLYSAYKYIQNLQALQWHSIVLILMERGSFSSFGQYHYVCINCWTYQVNC